MAVQYTCEVCGWSYPEITLIAIELTRKIMCPVCIDKLINDLSAEISAEKIVSILQDF